MEFHITFVYIAILIPLSLGETDLEPKPYGSSFNIECQSSREDIDHWTLDGDRVTGATNGIASSTIMSPNLHVEFMMLSLEGQYKCFGESSGLLSTINVFVIGRALYSLDDCQFSIGTCTNDLTYSRNDHIPLNANIVFNNVGSKNLTAMVVDTDWRVTFQNGTSRPLACAGNNTCTHMFSGLRITVSISSNRLNDSAIIYIDSAEYNFTITHTFHTQGLVSAPVMKIFNFHHIPTNDTSTSSIPTIMSTSTMSMSSSEVTNNSNVVMTTTTVTMTIDGSSDNIPTNTTQGSSRGDEDDGNTIAIVITVVVGIMVAFVIVVIVVLVIYWYRHSRQNSNNNNNKSRPTLLGLVAQGPASPSQEGRALMDNTATATPSDRHLEYGVPRQQTPNHVYDKRNGSNSAPIVENLNSFHHEDEDGPAVDANDFADIHSDNSLDV